MRNTLIVFTLFCLSCKNVLRNDSKDYFFIIKPNRVEVLAKGEEIPPLAPPPLFYGNHNFVLIDTSSVYYYRSHVYTGCVIRYPGKPPKAGITPGSLYKIEVGRLENFLDTNILDSTLTGSQSTIVISSSVDTIRNNSFNTIINYLDRKSQKLYWIRKWTEEERFVVASKNSGLPYIPEELEWRVGFIDGFEYIQNNKK